MRTRDSEPTGGTGTGTGTETDTDTDEGTEPGGTSVAEAADPSTEESLTREAASQLSEPAQLSEISDASALSTAPSEDRLNVASMGVLGWARWFWRQLTSMRVALILL